MTADALLARLRARGVSLRVEGDRIIATPARRLDAEKVEALRQAKQEIIAYIIADSSARVRRVRTHCLICAGPLPDDTWLRCPSCVDAANIAREARQNSRLKV